jgi:dTDP-4-dehydrorhamnose 3,5-epimerase
VKPLSPTTHDGPLDQAFEAAKEKREPIFSPAPVFTDDRGWSLMNQFKNVLAPTGQVNYSVMYPNVIKAWHRHAKQTDFWLCLHGHLKVGVYDEQTDRAWIAVIGEKRPGVLIIPPPLWHGAATVGVEPAGLLYYVTHQYDPAAPDEDRRDYDSVVGFPWETQHK